MKSFYKITAMSYSLVRTYLTLIIIVVSLLTMSCSKVEKKISPKGEKVSLVVRVSGVADASTVSNLKASLPSFQSPKLPGHQVYSKDDLYVDVIPVQQTNKAGFEGLLADSKGSKAHLLASNTVPMSSNHHYRILVYSNTDELVTSVDAVAGQDLHINVSSGETYKWYAYSYNTSAPIPAPDPNNPVITTPTATSLLYASGQITPIELGTALPITFKHQLTKLHVEVKESSGFRPILDVVGEFATDSYVKTSRFDILTGQKVGTLVSANIKQLSFHADTLADTIKRVASYYTADESLISYAVKLNSLQVQYTQNNARLLTTELPNAGEVTFGFTAGSANKKGYILKGVFQISFVLPTMRILPFATDLDQNTYRLGASTAPGVFLRTASNFGPSSNYVKIKSLSIDAPTVLNLGDVGSASWNRFINLMNNPANYPDILIIGNWYNYLNDHCWDLIKAYLDAGGNVFYGHDEPDPAYEKYAQRGISNILGQTVTMSDVVEFYGVYKFTDTQEARADSAILKGPFGDVRSYHWGQDRVGTGYINGYTGTDLIVYSTRAQNKVTPATPGMAFFRHKTKSFFFVGDGGFYNNGNGSTAILNYLEFPFRIDMTTKLPVLAAFGSSAPSGAPGYNPPSTNSNGAFQIANSAMFGNIISWMLHRAHVNPVDRSGALITP